MYVSSQWLTSTGGAFRASVGRSGVADLRCYNAAFCEWGQGPPIVLIPGLAGGLELLGPLARLLARRYHVISFDLRGEDDCFALRRRFDRTDLVNDLAEFLDWRGLERPILFGVSFGGVLALEFAARYPQRIHALALQGVGCRYERGLIQRVASLVLSGYPLPPNSPFVNQFFNLLFGGRPPRPMFEFVTRQCWQTDQSVMAHRLRLLERLDLTDDLARVQTPTLALCGDRDLLVSENSLDGLRRGLPRATIESLDGCGHLAFVTHPQRVAERFRAFLDGLTV